MNKRRMKIVGLLLAAALFTGCGSTAEIDTAARAETTSYDVSAKSTASGGLADRPYDAETNEGPEDGIMRITAKRMAQ